MISPEKLRAMVEAAYTETGLDAVCGSAVEFEDGRPVAACAVGVLFAQANFDSLNADEDVVEDYAYDFVAELIGKQNTDALIQGFDGYPLNAKGPTVAEYYRLGDSLRKDRFGI